MDDSLTPDPAAELAPVHAMEFDRLYRLIERLLDADLLLCEEGNALLDTIDLAHRCHRGGDREAARRHVTRLGLAIEALIQSGRLEEAHGRAALEIVLPTTAV